MCFIFSKPTVLFSCSQPNLFTICRFEFEADYIGYDPRLAPKFYEKIAKLDGSDNDSMLSCFFGTHPLGRERAKVLARPEIMEEALILYNDVTPRFLILIN
jgi:hypothetical protein